LRSYSKIANRNKESHKERRVTTISIVTEIRIGVLLAALKKRYSLFQLNTADPIDPN